MQTNYYKVVFWSSSLRYRAVGKIYIELIREKYIFCKIKNYQNALKLTKGSIPNHFEYW